MSRVAATEQGSSGKEADPGQDGPDVSRPHGAALPRPGLIGIAIRLAIAAVVGWMGYGAVVDAPSYWDGFAATGAVTAILPLALFSSWVVNELWQRRWGWRPSIALLLGAGAAAAAGALQGQPLGVPLGIYVWAWTLLFAGLLAPAHLLAVLLRTPGCEMRSYADLWTRIRGGDPATVACPGWIDRFDGVRLFGRW